MAVQRMSIQRVIRKLFINGQLSNEALVFTGLMIGIVATFFK
jgi:hypothetical protein